MFRRLLISTVSLAATLRHHLRTTIAPPGLLAEVLRYPLVLCGPSTCDGYSRQLAQMTRLVDRELIIVEKVASHDLMAMLIAGLSTEARVGQ